MAELSIAISSMCADRQCVQLLEINNQIRVLGIYVHRLIRLVQWNISHEKCGYLGMATKGKKYHKKERNIIQIR